MFRHGVRIGRILGIPIELDYSWFLIAVLTTWVLAVNYFPAEYKGGTSLEYWLMGAATAVLFFASIVLHELAHSFVAIEFKVPVSKITLFIFGGVSQIAGEPPSARAEFLIAVVGPLTSLTLAAVFYGLENLLANVAPVMALAKYLALINGMLGLFNLIPAFPLDGGRVFRAIVWGANKNFKRATLIAANTGRFFGFLFIVFGVGLALRGNLFNGLWIAFIGWFLENAAKSQVQQQAVQDVLAGHKVSELMSRDCTQVPSGLTLQELVEKFVLGGAHRCFVVTDGSKTTGLVTLEEIKKVPRTSWPTTTVEQAMIPAEKLISTPANAEAWSTIEKMGRNGVTQLPVVDGGKIVGMFSRDDLVHYLGVVHSLGT
jgi:Zn-dependent protease